MECLGGVASAERVIIINGHGAAADFVFAFAHHDAEGTGPLSLRTTCDFSWATRDFRKQ